MGLDDLVLDVQYVLSLPKYTYNLKLSVTKVGSTYLLSGRLVIFVRDCMRDEVCSIRS